LSSTAQFVHSDWHAAQQDRRSAAPSRSDGFVIDGGQQARHGWVFIQNLMCIASSNSTSETNDNVFFIKAFIRGGLLTSSFLFPRCSDGSVTFSFENFAL